MTTSTDLVSVVVAVKNGAATLQRCLASIMCQTSVRMEILAIDGASRDGTVEILQRNTTRLSYWCSEPDGGIYAAWNKGLRQARGAWISFLGSDDAFHDSRVLRDLVAASGSSTTRCRVVYGKMNLVSEGGKLVQTVGAPWLTCRQDFIDGFMIPHPGTLHHRSLFETHGWFDESYQLAGDYELLLRELSEGTPLFVDRVVVDMQLGGASGRPSTIHKALAEVKRARAQHGLTDVPPRLRRALFASQFGAAIHWLFGDRAFRCIADVYRRIRGLPPAWTV